VAAAVAASGNVRVQNPNQAGACADLRQTHAPWDAPIAAPASSNPPTFSDDKGLQGQGGKARLLNHTGTKDREELSAPRSALRLGFVASPGTAEVHLPLTDLKQHSSSMSLLLERPFPF